MSDTPQKPEEANPPPTPHTNPDPTPAPKPAPVKQKRARTQAQLDQLERARPARKAKRARLAAPQVVVRTSDDEMEEIEQPHEFHLGRNVAKYALLATLGAATAYVNFKFSDTPARKKQNTQAPKPEPKNDVPQAVHGRPPPATDPFHGLL